MNSEMLSYIKKDSPIHKLTGATKFILFLLWVITAMITYDTRLLVAMLIVGIVSFKISKNTLENGKTRDFYLKQYKNYSCALFL